MNMNEISDKLLNPLPHFANETMQKLTETMVTDAKQFAIEHYWCDRASINVHEVIGTQHPDYADTSWLNLLQNGKRMPLNLRLLGENPQYYFDTEIKRPSMQFIKIDNALYIGADGNHRTCIGKFFLYHNSAVNVHGITLDEYITDPVFRYAYEQVYEIIESERLPVITEVLRETVSRKDTAGWKRDTYSLALAVKNMASGVQETLSITDMFQFVAEAQKPLKSYFGRFKYFWKK